MGNTEAYDKGANDRASGFNSTFNPYPVSSQEAKHYNCGWSDKHRELAKKPR